MAFFRSLKQEQNWADELIENKIIPSYGSYAGIGALNNSDVLTAVSIVAGDVARFPIIEIQDKDDAVIDDEDLSYLINKKCNEFVSAYSWRFAMMVNALLTGNSYSRIIRDPISSRPLEIQFYPPSQTEVNESQTTNGTKYTYQFTPLNGQSTITCAAEDVIHFKFFTTDTIMGRSPLLSLGNELALQSDGVQTLQRFFKGGFKSGIIKAKGRLNKDSRRKIKQDFEYSQNNSDNGPIVTDETMDYTPLEVDTNVLNLINSNNWSTSQIAKVLRIPAYKLGINSPNQSVNQLQQGYVQYDLPFYFEAIVNELQMKLLTNDERAKYHFEFDIRKEVGMNMQDAATAISNGVLTPNEVRAEIGKKTVVDKDLDRYQSTLNSVFLDKKEKYQELKGGGILGQQRDPNH